MCACRRWSRRGCHCWATLKLDPSSQRPLLPPVLGTDDQSLHRRHSRSPFVGAAPRVRAVETVCTPNVAGPRKAALQTFEVLGCRDLRILCESPASQVGEVCLGGLSWPSVLNPTQEAPTGRLVSSLAPSFRKEARPGSPPRTGVCRCRVQGRAGAQCPRQNPRERLCSGSLSGSDGGRCDGAPVLRAACRQTLHICALSQVVALRTAFGFG